MRARLLPIALVLAVVVMVYLATQVGRQGAEMSQNAERIEQQTVEMEARFGSPAP